MKKTIMGATMAVLAFSGMASKLQQRESRIDWCSNESSDQCYCNKIDSEGAKIVLINLDDHCQLDSLEDAGGVFLLSGDMLIISGRQNTTAGQAWTLGDAYDTGVVALSSSSGVDVSISDNI